MARLNLGIDLNDEKSVNFSSPTVYNCTTQSKSRNINCDNKLYHSSATTSVNVPQNSKHFNSYSSPIQTKSSQFLPTSHLSLSPKTQLHPNNSSFPPSQCLSGVVSNAPKLPARRKFSNTENNISQFFRKEYKIANQTKSQPIIFPITDDNENQISYTHYWLFYDTCDLSDQPIKKSSSMQTLAKLSKDERSASNNNLLKLDGPKMKPKKSLESLFFGKLNKPSSSPPKIKKDTKRSENICNSSTKNNISSTNTALQKFENMSPEDNVYQVMIDAQGATKEEAYTALCQCSWNVPSAVNFLKVEQLFRLGLTTREKCRSELIHHKWNLEQAASCLVEELSIKSRNKHSKSISHT